MVHDLVHLGREEPVDLGDARIDRDVHVLGHRQSPAHDLIDEFADHVFGPFFLVIVAGQLAVRQDLVKEAALLSGCLQQLECRLYSCSAWPFLISPPYFHRYRAHRLIVFAYRRLR